MFLNYAEIEGFRDDGKGFAHKLLADHGIEGTNNQLEKLLDRDILKYR